MVLLLFMLDATVRVMQAASRDAEFAVVTLYWPGS
jgi:hypothetical protein